MIDSYLRFCKTKRLNILLLSLAVLASCKGDSGKQPSPAQPTPIGASESSAASITLDSKAPGSTLNVSNADLSQSGGYAIQITGIAEANLVLGLTSSPNGVVIDNAAGVHRLTGIMPSTSAQPHDLVIFARDKSQCTGNNCTIAPNGNGIFSAGQVVFNSASDVQANFKLQLDSSALTDGPSWYEKFKTGLGKSAVSFLEFLKKFFEDLR